MTCLYTNDISEGHTGHLIWPALPLLIYGDVSVSGADNLNFYFLYAALSPRFVSALQELTGGRTTEVLSVLQNVSLTGKPVAISFWDVL